MQWLPGTALMAALLTSTLSSAAILTPERLLSAPRPGGGVANAAGTRALVGTRTFSFERDAYDDALFSVALPAGQDLGRAEPLSSPPQLVSRSTSKGVWLSDDVVAYVDAKSNTMYACDITAGEGQDWAVVGVFPAPVDTMRVAHTKKGGTTLVFSAQVYADGDLGAVKGHDESAAVKEWSRVKVYDSTFVRHWDHWLYPGKRSQLFAVDFSMDSDRSFSGPIRSLLNGTALEAPVAPFGDEGDYAVSATHVAFTSKDPDLNKAWHTKQNIYLAPLDGSSAPVKLTKGKHGATSSPAFSPDGKQLAWLQMDRDGFESDKRKIYTSDLEGITGQSVHLQDWELSPSSVSFSLDGETLVGIVEDAEQNLVFQVSTASKAGQDKATKLSQYGGAESLQLIPQGILVSASSLFGPTDLYILAPHAPHSKDLDASALRLTNFGQQEGSSLAGIDLGRHPEQFSFAGAHGRTSHGWIHYPPGYDHHKTYALAVLIHGGPEGAWTNSWSFRWNPAVFAAQGFLVVTLDPAGSSGFGQEYQEEILGNWGGAPFEDIRAGTKHTLKRFPNIDPNRVVAAGASYGGYMINWINGHNKDKLFKGLVCHDGVFSTLSTFYSTEELYFPEFEFGGPPWLARDEYEKWSPEKHTQHWETPQLTIAGGKDYRLPESEGISVFNTLQRRGVPSRLVYFPDENHWVREPKNSLKWHQEVLAWLLKYSAPAVDEAVGEADGHVAPLVFQASGQ